MIPRAKKLEGYKRMADVGDNWLPIVYTENIYPLEIERGSKGFFYKEQRDPNRQDGIDEFENFIGMADNLVAFFKSLNEPDRICRVKVISTFPYLEFELVEKIRDLS